MNDKELADRIVAFDLGPAHWNASQLDLYRIGGDYDMPMNAEELVRDWRVAGALMEKVDSFDVIKGRHHDRWQNSCAVRFKGKPADAVNDSLPRAMCEACVAALDEMEGK